MPRPPRSKHGIDLGVAFFFREELSGTSFRYEFAQCGCSKVVRFLFLPQKVQPLLNNSADAGVVACCDKVLNEAVLRVRQ